MSWLNQIIVLAVLAGMAVLAIRMACGRSVGLISTAAAVLFSMFSSGCVHRQPRVEYVYIQVPEDSGAHAVSSEDGQIGRTEFDGTPQAVQTRQMTVCLEKAGQGTVGESTVFPVGSRITVTVIEPEDGYSYLVSVGPTGDVYLLWPSKVATLSNQVREGQRIVLGPFPVVRPVGVENLIVLWSPVPLADTDTILRLVALTPVANGATTELKRAIETNWRSAAPGTRGVEFSSGTFNADLGCTEYPMNVVGTANVVRFQVHSTE